MASAEKRQRWADQAKARQARARRPAGISYFKIFIAVLAALLVALWVLRNVSEAHADQIPDVFGPDVLYSKQVRLRTVEPFRQYRAAIAQRVQSDAQVSGYVIDSCVRRARRKVLCSVWTSERWSGVVWNGWTDWLAVSTNGHIRARIRWTPL